MAILDPEEDRPKWLPWAIELERRGVWPVGEIEVHGPHAPPANGEWGEAECTTMDGHVVTVDFGTVGGAAGVRMRIRDGEALRVLPVAELTADLREKLRGARIELRQLQRLE